MGFTVMFVKVGISKNKNKKMNFDSLTKKSSRVTATTLSNPLIVSWTTAFIRSVVGECLHNIQKLGGKVVSVTTDGFITDIEDLEKNYYHYHLMKLFYFQSKELWEKICVTHQRHLK